ncbi:enoyl-CoA hydratase/isomerase family protein [Streptomyces variegatus]|uniref:enoyl-CoA hydratase/isomerase family protein n=1 Tax=Streptomyces variegatus TaxID=284040 RepID=UPI003C2D7458
MGGSVDVTQRGGVLIARMDNPPLALMDEATVEGIAAVLGRAERDPAIGGVVLTGSHPSRFLAHYDVGELLATAKSGPAFSPRGARRVLRVTRAVRRLPGGDRVLRRSPAAGLARLQRFHEVLLGIQRSSAVWVAAVNGSALGGGCELALACDVRLMAAGEHFIGQPEIMLGFPPGGGGTQRLARLLGPSRALRMVLDGTPLSPDQAVELGLIDQVVELDALLDAAVAEAAHLGSRPKAAIGACKRAVYVGGSQSLDAGLFLENSEVLSAMGTQEAQDAMAAYVRQTELVGDLPAYDPEVTKEAFARGRFV